MFFLLLLIPLLLGFAFFFDFGGPDDGMDGSDGDDNQGGGGTIDPGDNGTGTGGGVNGGPDDPNVTVDNTGAIYLTDQIDLYYAGAGAQEIHALQGDDTVSGQLGDDTIFGEEGNDELYGGFGQDYIEGNAGNDSLYGSFDDDELHGNGGNDFVSGGGGNDDGDDIGRPHDRSPPANSLSARTLSAEFLPSRNSSPCSSR